MTKATDDKTDGPAMPEPVDVIDGIPDRSPPASWWRYAVLLAVFAAWVAFLIYVRIAGSA